MIFAKVGSGTLHLHKPNPVFELTQILAVMLLLVGLINILHFALYYRYRKTKTGWIKGQIWSCLAPFGLGAMLLVFCSIL